MITFNEPPPPPQQPISPTLEAPQVEGLSHSTKAILIVLGMLVLGAAGPLSYKAYEAAKENEPLTRWTPHNDWQWQDTSSAHLDPSSTQWRLNSDGNFFMRRVHDDKEVWAYLEWADEGSMELMAYAYFPVHCIPGTEIETSVSVSDGIQTLKCATGLHGTNLWVGVSWSDVDTNDLPRWRADFDGFAVNEDFDSKQWDFRPALRSLTLQRAKLPGQETKQ